MSGPANCRGITHHGNDDFDISEKPTRRTPARLAAYGPQAVPGHFARKPA